MREAIDFGRNLWLSCHKNFLSLNRRISAISDSLSDTQLREEGSEFLPKFNDNGLLTAIAQDVSSREILMVAFMNAEALAKTQETGIAHFYSRSRKQQWMKGESSGNILRVKSIRVDCDQDALIMAVEAAGPACHTGEVSCFYRELSDGKLVRV